jgi:trk system potassium uptake protein TrkH
MRSLTTRRAQDAFHYGTIWVAGGSALVLLVLQVLYRFRPGFGVAVLQMADLGIAALLYIAALRSRAQAERRDLEPFSVKVEQAWALGFAALTLIELALVVGADRSYPGVSATSALGKAVIVVLALRLRSRLLAREYATSVRALVLSPPATVAASFGLAITAGWLLLVLPEASASGQSVGALDALFTSTSAVCVTGLIVRDTPRDFSLLGLVVILLLIQFGGLGIMTLAAMFGAARGQKVSMRARMIVRDTLVAQDPHAVGRTLGLIALFTFSVEAIGAALLYLRWVLGGETPVRAAWLAVFHAISAFCNAGFSLFSNSLEDYSADPLVNIVIGGLIVVGGLGMPVVLDLWHTARLRQMGRRARLTLHTRLTLTTTGCLLLLGFVGFWLLEWTHIMLRQDWAEAFWSAGFQSITPRTAGFNTVPMGALTEATKFLLVLLMFVGASPGSTGGGVKTTTLAVVSVLARAMILGESRVQAFRRAIPEQVRHRAVAILILFGGSVLLWTFALCISEGGRFIDVLFETVSAFGTVGLSTGMTPTLTRFGRVAIILAMYIGRVGPLTLALAMARRKPAVELAYPEEPVMVG